MNKAYLLIDGDIAIGAIFDLELAQEIADIFDFELEEVEYVDEVN